MFAAIVLTEIRYLRRLARTWLLAVFTIGIGLGIFVRYSFIHYIDSSQSQTIGSIPPAYLIHSFGSIALLVALFLATLLTFDFRDRAVRERINEVLDSKPLRNLQFVGGVIIGQLVIVWGVMALLVVLVQGYGLAVPFVDQIVGRAADWSSTAWFVLVDVPVAAGLWGSVVVLISVLLKNRWLTLVAISIVWVLHICVLFAIPLKFLPTFSFLPLFAQYASGFNNDLTDLTYLCNRLACVALTLGFAVTCSLLVPRIDSVNRRRWSAFGGIFIAMANLAMLWSIFSNHAERTTRESWLTAHEVLAGEPQVDVHELKGRIDIRPENAVDYSVSFLLEPRRNTRIADFVVTLNPGMTVDEVTLNGESIAFRHELGLIKMHSERVIPEGQKVEFHFSVSGMPDPEFAYLDAALNAMDESLLHSQLYTLGTESSVLSDSYIALMPGTRWLPHFGPNLSNSDHSTLRDFHMVDLLISLPEGWRIVGPGLVEDIAESKEGKSIYRLNSEIPVPNVALFANKFSLWSEVIGKVRFEFLMLDDHARNLGFLRDYSSDLKRIVGSKLENLRSMGLDFPYSKYTFVEVPSNLRVYGGGFHMASVQSHPSVMLLREFGLPNSHLDARWSKIKADTDEAILEEFFDSYFAGMFYEYFEQDRSGGNILKGIADALYKHQTCMVDDQGAVYDRILQEAAYNQIHDSPNFYSSYAFVPRRTLESHLTESLRGFPIVDIVMGNTAGVQFYSKEQAERPLVWEIAINYSWIELAKQEDAVTAAFAMEKQIQSAGAVMKVSVTRPEIRELMQYVTKEYRGSSFTSFELKPSNSGLQQNWDVYLQGLVAPKGRPAFRIGPVRAEPVQVSAEDETIYQNYFVTVRNDGLSEGYVYVDPMIWLESETETQLISVRLNDVIRVPAQSSVEYGFGLPFHVSRVTLTPISLSRNRYSIATDLPPLQNPEAQIGKPFRGVRPSDWSGIESPDGIVVDDLDEGFSLHRGSTDDVIAADAKSIAETIELGYGDLEFDRGIPAYRVEGYEDLWSRVDYIESWGKYRRTHTFAEAGTGNWKVRFSTTLPSAGTWELHYFNPLSVHFPPKFDAPSQPAFRERTGMRSFHQGGYEVNLISGHSVQPIEYRPSDEPVGWVWLGEFELAAGEVSVVVANATDGEGVYADAIRWRRKEQ